MSVCKHMDRFGLDVSHPFIGRHFRFLGSLATAAPIQAAHMGGQSTKKHGRQFAPNFAACETEESRCTVFEGLFVSGSSSPHKGVLQQLCHLDQQKPSSVFGVFGEALFELSLAWPNSELHHVVRQLYIYIFICTCLNKYIIYIYIYGRPPIDPYFLPSTTYSGKIPSASHEKSSLWVQRYITSFSHTRARAPSMSMPHLN